jgi:hypothetical protein
MQAKQRIHNLGERGVSRRTGAGGLGMGGDSRHLGHIHDKQALTVTLCTLDAYTITIFTALQRRGIVDFHNGHPVIANIGQAKVERVVLVEVIYSTMSWVREIPKRPFANESTGVSQSGKRGRIAARLLEEIGTLCTIKESKIARILSVQNTICLIQMFMSFSSPMGAQMLISSHGDSWNQSEKCEKCDARREHHKLS